MKKYDIFLFDADGTLYDYDKAEENALRIMLEYCGFCYSETIRAKYRVINSEVWSAYEKGELSISDFPKIRFERLFSAIGVQCDDAGDFNSRYLAELGKGTFLIDGAVEICKAITASNKPIYIVTNGLLATQEARIKHSLIKDYITDTFVSSFVGYQKPDKEYFDYVFSRIPQVSKDKILIVGDSLTADIAGGNNAGIDTCWYNELGIENSTDIEPIYEVRRLSEIRKFI